MELGSSEAHKFLKVLQLHQPFGACTADVDVVDHKRHNFWLVHGQPTDEEGENKHRGNGAVLNHSNYIVKSSCRSHNNTSNTSE